MAGSQGDMSPETARRLTALIVAGAEQLEEKSQQLGVTAFVGRAVQRERPNERFLQSTLRNVASSNRREDERAMWAAWEARKQLQESSIRAPIRRADSGRCTSRDVCNWRGSRKRRRSSSSSRERDAAGGASRTSRSRSRHRSKQDREFHHSRRTEVDASGAASSGGNNGGSCSSSHSASSAEDQSSESSSTVSSGGKGAAAAVGDQPGPPAAADYVDDDHHDGGGDDGDDQQLLQWLGSSQKVRGRGAVGPSANMPGPFLEAPSGLSPAELQQLDRGTAKGPERPSWMQRDEKERRRLRPNAGFLQGLLRAQGLVPAEGSGSQRGLRQGAEPDPQARPISTERSRSRGSGEGSSGSGSSEGRVRKKRSKSKKRKRKHKRSSKHKKKHKVRDSS